MNGRLLRLSLLVAACFAPACGRPAPGAAPASPATRAEAPPPAATPPARCSPDPLAPAALARRAADALDREDAAQALGCADEALRAAPRLAPALQARAEALTELGRIEEARLAWARLLAMDPDDPHALLGAADLYVSHRGGDRASLELGLEYARRGVRAARGDRELAAGLHVVAAMAENDLGRSRDALGHARKALALRRGDVDARYEEGVALYELCRFQEARTSLERVLADAPDDPWALHYLALVAERTGGGRRARDLERRAREIAPRDFPAPVEIGRAEFAAEVRRAIAALPDADQRALATVPIDVDDVPALDDLVAVDPPLSPSILGLYRGPPEAEPCLPDDGPRCRSIALYRLNLARFARSRAELATQVRITLLHELGHLHGESDDDLRARGLE